jgi:alkylation response protein AidB-like acyl-CoA dehydrogenase
MDLELSEDEAALRDNVRSVLAGICPPAVVRTAYEVGDAGCAVWTHMVALGWPALTIAEPHGGLGLGFVELALVAEELGRAVAPGPLLATLSQFVPVVSEVGDHRAAARYLPRVAEGTLTGTLAIAERGRWDAAAVQATARRAGEMWVLDGVKSTVVDGATADEIVVIARGVDGLGVFVVPGTEVVVSPRQLFDPTIAVCDITLAGVVVGGDRVLAAPGAEGVDAALRRATQQAAVAMAAMTVGACRVIFETTVAYAKVREQYGKPIGSFQALKHRIVDMYLSVERATALVYYAALAIAEDAPDRATAAAAAKAAAGDCQRLVVEEGLQLHGGIGFTWENDLHFWLKRAKTGDALFGAATAQRAALAELLGILADAAVGR